ncbi:MAG: undecaprenyldiphospho-muramoylpentapeptide beta-N-acetylglucosaminyltransferase [Rhodospirillaceae bacterium]|nr:undecaprenyldiphospho-muramoylpentapeptide beta-N-acetylglucosaminyltransferase [Rhodospirillaceae bacterium]
MIVPRQTHERLIVLTAGGTGGHVFPAEALAQALLNEGYRLALITDQRGTHYSGTLGMIDTHAVSGQGIAGRGLLGLVKGTVALGLGVLQARTILAKLKPAAVVGFGGYASAPAMFAAVQLGIPTVIHEQNAILGRANRLLAGRVNQVCTSFELAKPAPEKARVMRTGMPVRPAVAALRNAPYAAPDGGPFRILVLGGSQGARVFSDVLPAAMRLLPEALRNRMEITQQCRPEDLDRTHAAYVGTGAHAHLRVFFDNVPELLAGTHLLIARSGASTVAEVTLIGRPSILVPYPYAADDHQSANAAALAAQGGTWMLKQNGFTPEALAERIATLAAAPDLLTETAAAAARFAIPDAAQRLAAVVETVMRGDARTNTAAPAMAPPSRIEPMKRGVI